MHNLLANLNLLQGPITYAYTALEVDYHCTQLLKEGPQAVGFDIEWRVTYKPGEVRKTALLQLCHRIQQGQYKCLLLHVAHTGLTPALIEILQREVCFDLDQVSQLVFCFAMPGLHSAATMHGV